MTRIVLVGLDKSERKNYKFNPSTRKEAVKQAKYHCECCGITLNGKKASQAEVHHLLPVWAVANYCPEVSASVISNLANAVVLCHTCHKRLHQKEIDLDSFYYESLQELKRLELLMLENSANKKLNGEALRLLINKKNHVLNFLKK